MGIEEEAISFSVVANVLKIFFLILVLTTIVIFVTFYSKINITSYEAESEIFIHRMLYSPTGISYYDAISGRVYPGIIDLSKFKTNELQKSIDYGGDKHLGARISIKNIAGIPLALLTYNNQTHQKIAKRGKKGPGGVDIKEKTLYVLAKNRNKITPAIMNISIVVERSR